MLTSGTGISPDQFWIESTCERCGEKIPCGEPRRIVAFLSLAYGPGSPEYQDAETEIGPDEDAEMLQLLGVNVQKSAADPMEDVGLESQSAIVFCIPCSGEYPHISNPWNEDREQRAADDTGGSVRAIPISQMRQVRTDEEVVADYRESCGSGPAYLVRRSASVEEQETILSGCAAPAKIRVASARRTRSEMTENDHRDRMARFLRANPSGMHGKKLQVCTLWAQGKKQAEIERETGIDQSTVCRLVRSGKAMLG